MRFSKSHKNKKASGNLWVVKDVKAQDLKNLNITYSLLRNGYNYEFLIETEYLPKLINLVEDRHKDFWRDHINKAMKN